MRSSARRVPGRSTSSAAAALAALAALSTLVAPPAAAAAPGCAVAYTVTAQWSGGFIADVKITNLGDLVTGWTLTWTFTAGQEVRTRWGADISQTGAQVTARDVAHNAVIPTGGKAEFGFGGSSIGTVNPPPVAFALNGTPCVEGSAPRPTAPPAGSRYRAGSWAQPTG